MRIVIDPEVPKRGDTMRIWDLDNERDRGLLLELANINIKQIPGDSILRRIIFSLKEEAQKSVLAPPKA